VTAKILGESVGPKIDIFKYKNKTGYRRRQGHRQKYTQIEITEIKLPGAKAKSASKAAGTSKAAGASQAAGTSKAAGASKATSTKKTTKSSEEE
jgi:hypothetical protein